MMRNTLPKAIFSSLKNQSYFFNFKHFKYELLFDSFKKLW